MTGRNLDLDATFARPLRADSIRCSTAAGSGHPTSSIDVATRIGQTRRAARSGGNLGEARRRCGEGARRLRVGSMSAIALAAP